MCKDHDAPTVSVIIPVYNTEAELPACLDSFYKQAGIDYELILVDDGSTDNSPQICDFYAANHSNTKVIHQTNHGLSQARLAGFQQADGEYILFADSDDYVHPHMLQKLADSMTETGAELAYCAYSVKRGNNEKTVYLPYCVALLSGRDQIIEEYIKPLIGRQREKSIPGFIWLRMMKKALIESAFFQSENVYFMEDHVFNLLYADRIKKIAIINEPLYTYRIREVSLSNCYRSGKYKMLSRLYRFYEQYLSDREITGCQEQLDSFSLFSFYQAIDNAVLSGNYRKYRKELRKLREENIAEVRGAFHTCQLSWMQALIYKLYQYHFYYLLYIIRRWRFSKI